MIPSDLLAVSERTEVLLEGVSVPTVLLSAVFLTGSSNLTGRCEKSHVVRKTSREEATVNA